MQRGLAASRWGFFLRAETMHGWYSYQRGQPQQVGPQPRFHELSHGESFLALLETRFEGGGLYCLDEPEAALSFSSTLALIAVLQRVVAAKGQVLCATHSPVLASMPGARILEVGDWGLRETTLGGPGAGVALEAVPGRPAGLPAPPVRRLTAPDGRRQRLTLDTVLELDETVPGRHRRPGDHDSLVNISTGESSSMNVSPGSALTPSMTMPGAVGDVAALDVHALGRAVAVPVPAVEADADAHDSMAGRRDACLGRVHQGGPDAATLEGVRAR